MKRIVLSLSMVMMALSGWSQPGPNDTVSDSFWAYSSYKFGALTPLYFIWDSPASSNQVELIGGRFYNYGDETVLGECRVVGSFIGGTNCNQYNLSTNIFIGGGKGNSVGAYGLALGNYGSIAGGINNAITNSTSGFIGGGGGNLISGKGSATDYYNAIAGGSINKIVGETYSFIGGGSGNRIDSGASASAIAGGSANSASNATSAFIGGGSHNAVTSSSVTPNATYSGISCGYGNKVEGKYGIIGGGYNNTIQSWTWNNNPNGYTVIAGGGNNMVNTNSGEQNYHAGSFAANYFSTIGGGGYNMIDSPVSTIAGGGDNVIYGAPGSCIVGGDTCMISNASQSFIGGGITNTIFSSYGVICGGVLNRITNSSGGSATASVIAGGTLNMVTNAEASVIGGGSLNKTTGAGGTIPGGNVNIAGVGAFAAGTHASATNDYSFVWNDGGNYGNSTANNQFLISASGGIVTTGSVFTAGSGINVMTNTPPANVTVGTTPPDAWLVIQGNGTTLYVPAYVNH